ncbi:hypothetical protein [Sediminispirochaeta bajacaliforniensis]|uniref:hypothetical protein n=1 Tax=Sediminispirochaeta bajacaliforniensis TaxID=148 RepID=UPI00037B5959|nr:hypothetical protein [Sediminispirochaeta bajacaliforniensis]
MDNQAIVDFLVSLEAPATEVTVVQSGKSSEKVDGLYKPFDRTIILHNRNASMQEPSFLLRMAIHQYTHHLLIYGTAQDPVPLAEPREEVARHHGSRFSACYHRLLSKAAGTDAGVAGAPWDVDPELSAVADRIRGTLLPQYGGIALELGAQYAEAERLCAQKGYNLEEWLEDAVGADLADAKRMLRAHHEGLSPKIGFDAMKSLLKIPKEHRREAEAAVVSGDRSPKAVESDFRPPFRREANTEEGSDNNNASFAVERLQKEKLRLEQKMEQIRARLLKLEARLHSMGVDDE